jgi:hypothetical protein
VAPGVDLTDIQSAVSNVLDQHGLLVAAGPMGAGLVGRLVTKNKLVSNVLMGGGALIAVQQLSGPYLQLMKDQFGYLTSLLGH